MKVGLLTSRDLSDFRLKTLKPILEDDAFSIEVAVIDARPGKSLKQKVKKHLRRGRGGYIAVMAWQSIFSKEDSGGMSTAEFCSRHQIDVIETRAPRSPETAAQIKKYGLDVLLLVGGYGIIKEPLLSLPPAGILSYHHGNMRKYRGMPPAFWELYNGEKEMGVTVQILAPGLDKGIPVEEKTIAIRKKDSLKTLEARAYEESTDMLYNALKKLNSEQFVPTAIDKFGKVYTLPNLRQWLGLRLKILKRQWT